MTTSRTLADALGMVTMLSVVPFAVGSAQEGDPAERSGQWQLAAEQVHPDRRILGPIMAQSTEWLPDWTCESGCPPPAQASHR